MNALDRARDNAASAAPGLRRSLSPTRLTFYALGNILGALIQIIMASRVGCGLARQNWIPGIFGRVHPRTRTPVIGTLAEAASVLLMALWFRWKCSRG